MKFCSLYSGSSGNSLYIAQNSTHILVDAGLSGKRIEQAMASIEADPKALTGILVTHEHRDHIHGVGVLSRRYNLPIYANAGTWDGMANMLGKIADHNVCLFETGKAFAIGDLNITSFNTSHDAAESVGYILDSGSCTMAIATDTGIATPQMVECLKGHDLVVLESNHDPGMLETGSYPFPLKQRIKGEQGHLSNAVAAEVACELVDSGVKHLVLAHLSQENNFPILAYQTTDNALTEKGMLSGHDVTLEVAGRGQCSDQYDL